jgi:hypothetical protein
MAGWDFTKATVVSPPVYSCSVYVIVLSPHSMIYITELMYDRLKDTRVKIYRKQLILNVVLQAVFF